jgi:hypothetical protein
MPPDHGGMNATKPIQIFKAGKHAAMSGEVLSFSESDLEASVRAYDPKLHEAPLVIGHPKHDAPAYGWVQALSATGDFMEAVPHQVDPAFAEMVGAGRFKKVSASFYKPDSPNNPVPGVYYLRHVGFLGAQPPAVKGLKAVEFADADGDLVEFADWSDALVARLLRRLREWIIGRDGLEEADKVLPDWDITALEDEARREDDSRPAFADPLPPLGRPEAAGAPSGGSEPQASVGAQFHAPAGASPAEPTHEESNAVTPEEKAALEAENAQLKQRLAEADAREKAAAAAKRHGDHLAYAEQLVADGKLAPKHKDAVVAFLDFADGDAPLEFGEGDAKQPLAGAFKSFLGDLPKVVEFGETATKRKAGQQSGGDSVDYGENVDQDRLALDRKIRQHMQEHQVDYATAAACVIK